MATQKKPDQAWIHRQAGLAIQFEWQDKALETGEKAELNSTEILGKFSDKEAWLVACHLTATDAVADGEYWWPVKDFLVVWKREDGMPTSRHATDEEIAMFGADNEEEE